MPKIRKRTKPLVKITTIEGRRNSSDEGLAAGEYSIQRERLISADTKIGKTRAAT